MRFTKRMLAAILGTALCLGVVATGCNKQNDPQETTTAAQISETPTATQEATTEPLTETTEEPTTTEAPITISLLSIGDMLMHVGVSNQASWSGNWDYSYLFTHIADDVAAADLAIVNNEVIFGGNDRGLQNYPCFNVRTELGDCEVATGFDVMLFATNHTMDQGIDGVYNCVNFWNETYPDITLLGIHESQEDANEISVVDVNGIKLALLNYTYGLNGYNLPEGHEYAVDLMNEWTQSKMTSDIAKAKELADLVIVFPHWGSEYVMEQTAEEEAWAQFFADNGVDLVIGTHPHVCQPVKWVEGANGNKMLCYYSLGNFTSRQPYHYSMLGGMAKVQITKDSTGTYVSDYGIRYLVTHYNSDASQMTTYYLDDYTDDLAAQHAWTADAEDEKINAYYPFTVAGLKYLAESITPDLVDY